MISYSISISLYSLKKLLALILVPKMLDEIVDILIIKRSFDEFEVVRRLAFHLAFEQRLK